MSVSSTVSWKSAEGQGGFTAGILATEGMKDIVLIHTPLLRRGVYAPRSAKVKKTKKKQCLIGRSLFGLQRTYRATRKFPSPGSTKGYFGIDCFHVHTLRKKKAIFFEFRKACPGIMSGKYELEGKRSWGRWRNWQRRKSLRSNVKRSTLSQK